MSKHRSKAARRSSRCLGEGAPLRGKQQQAAAHPSVWASLAQSITRSRSDVDAEAAHRQQALAMPSAGAASAAAPSAEPPGAAAAAAATQGTTAQRTGHLAPPGGHAEASAAATPAAGRWWQGGGTISVGVRLAAEHLLQLAELIGAAVRRSLAWRPRGATAQTPSPRRAGGPPPAAGMGRPPHLPSSPAPPGLFDESNSPRSTNS